MREETAPTRQYDLIPWSKPVTSTKGWNPSPQMVEVAAMVGRRATTPWSEKEISSFKKIAAYFQFSGDDWNALKWYYNESACQYVRKDLQTLLNNWQGEIDRAKQYDPSENR